MAAKLRSNVSARFLRPDAFCRDAPDSVFKFKMISRIVSCHLRTQHSKLKALRGYHVRLSDWLGGRAILAGQFETTISDLTIPTLVFSRK